MNNKNILELLLQELKKELICNNYMVKVYNEYGEEFVSNMVTTTENFIITMLKYTPTNRIDRMEAVKINMTTLEIRSLTNGNISYYDGFQYYDDLYYCVMLCLDKIKNLNVR